MGISGRHKVFISHGWADKWVALQIERCVAECGCEKFVDVFDIEKGDDIADRIRAEIPTCDELLALLTPWSADRNWVWTEIGAAWGQGKRIIAVLYGISLDELDSEKGGKIFLGAKNIVEINELDTYLTQLKARALK